MIAAMHLADARRCQLLRAFESPITPPWTEADATWAGDAARRLAGDAATAERFVTERARQGLRRLADRDPALRPMLDHLILPSSGWQPLAMAFVAGALAAGVAADAIGSQGRIHLLAPPLLVLLGWNLLVYAALAVSGLAALGRRGATAPVGLRRLAARALAWAGSRTTAARPSRDGHPPPPDASVAAALQRFAVHATPMALPVWSARAAALLHSAAAAFAAGALASLYLRGLAFEYRAGWDSTFLDPTQALAMVSVVLGPASWLTGLSLPDGAAFAALRFSTGPGENAARWIHLWAATLLGAVVLPRTVLAVLAALRAARCERRVLLPWSEPYFARLAAAAAGRDLVLRLLPFGRRPGPGALAALSESVHRAFGPGAAVHLLDPVAEGDEDADVALSAGPPDGGSRWLVGVVPLSATPERETHGRFLQALEVRRATGQPALLLVDEAGFGARLDPVDAATRREQRRAAWRTLAADLDHTPVFIDLGGQPIPDESRDALVTALRPTTH
jgi:hypothetical protein